MKLLPRDWGDPAIGVTEKQRRLSVSALVLGASTAWLLWRGIHSAPLGPSPARIIEVERTQLIGPAIIGFVLLVVLFERLSPAVQRPLLARGHVHDGLYTVFYAVAVVPLVALTGFGFNSLVHQSAPWLMASRLGFLPRWFLVVLAVLAMDVCNWLAHLANHRVGPLWRFHSLHHSQEEMSILTSFRAHPLVHSAFLVSTIPVALLLTGGGIPSAIITVYICLGALPHANLRWRLGPLGWLIVSPAYHRRHHATVGRLDVNLGTVLTVWDVLTRRALFPEAGDEVVAPTGLANRPIPVEQSARRPRHLGLLTAQLLEPFSVPALSHEPRSPRTTSSTAAPSMEATSSVS